jgi:hypothetical protein
MMWLYTYRKVRNVSISGRQISLDLARERAYIGRDFDVTKVGVVV